MRCGSTCSNCEPDEEEFLTVNVLKDISLDPVIEPTFQIKETHYATDSNSSSTNMSSNSISAVETADNPSLELCSIAYFAGYLAKKCRDKFCVMGVLNQKQRLFE